MNKHIKFISALVMGVIMMIGFNACSKADPEGEPEEELQPGAKPDKDGVMKVVLSRKTAYGNDWIYFSLAEGKELTGIDESNRESNLKWDLAFNRYNVRTNSGLSGKGKGGAMDTGKTNLKDVAKVPEGKFEEDVMGKITESMSSFPPPEMDSPLNKVLGTAIKFQGPPPTYTPNNHVYIVRTADGKYAKLKITGFYDDEGRSGFMNFEYVYQPDGSTTFPQK